ncbi:MAG: CBS domain-containing protein [Oscillospiraceae bacterium]|nr:CBS domain-containing protein [Oscillospiraceae bacterium]
MNLLFFLTPKAICSYLYNDYTLRQAIERMEHGRFTALPILTREGMYCGTLTEGDLLWAVKNLGCLDMRKAEEHSIMEIAHRKDFLPVSVCTQMKDLLLKATDQNFVPVVDDKGDFIGIVTRRAIMRYCLDTYIMPQPVHSE